MFHFYFSWKLLGVETFSGGIEMGHGAKMG